MSRDESYVATPLGPQTQVVRSIGNGRYLLARRLAEGGTATVHLGYDKANRRWRAIKMLLPEYARRPGLRHRFEIEGRTMAELRHPNVIEVFEAGQDGDAAWLVMEFAEGGSVVDWLERHGKMPPKLACHVAIGLCDGIQYAHERGIVHRDVKPQNVLVNGAGEIKVTDFGIAQVVEETRVTMTGTVMGTLGYMAPEQHESAKHADHRADVYSIAATLYTLMAGESPTHLFMADDDDFAAFPPALAAVIRKGSQYRREARYETVAEMAEVIRAAVATLPDDPPDTPPLVPANALKLDQLAPPSGLPDAEADTATVPAAPARTFHLPPPDSLTRVTVPPPPARSEPPAPLDRTSGALVRRSLSEEDTAPRFTARPAAERSAREELARRDRLRRLATGAAMALALLVVLGTGVVGWGAWRVGQWDTVEAAARQQIYDQIHQERTLLDVLGPLDVPQYDELRALFDEVDAGDAVQKEEASLRLVATLEQVRRGLVTRGTTREEHAVKQLAESMRRLQDRITDHERVGLRVAEVRSSGAGRIATALGF